MQRYTNVTQDALGNVIQAMSVSVFLQGTQTLATIYSDNGITTKPNPTTTEALGTFFFYATSGRYDLQFSKLGLPATQLLDVLLEDPQDATGGSVESQPTVAALKALSGTQLLGQVQVLGYYASGDGGGGLFRWNSTDATVDNGGTVIIPNSAPATGRWNRVTDSWTKADWFGVNASQNAAVNTPALNAALAAGSVIELPAGTLDLNALAAITLASKIIFGQGRATLLRFNTTGKGFTFGPFGTPSQNFNVRMSDMAFTNITNVPSAYISQENYTNSVFERLYFPTNTAATYGIDQVSGYGTKIQDCVWLFFVGTPIRLRDNGAAPNYSYVATIEHVDITSPSVNGVEVEATNTLKIFSSVIEGCGGDGIKTSTNGSGVTTLEIDNVDFESNIGNAINLQTNGGSYWGRATAMNCNFSGGERIALGSKSKITFIGIQSSPVTVTGSANAEVTTIGCENAQLVQSGSFSWTALVNSMVYTLARSGASVSCPVDTNEDVLATITVPRYRMGPNGYLRIWTTWSHTNNANNKVQRIRYSGAAGTKYAEFTVSATDVERYLTEILNANATNAQKGGMIINSSGFGTIVGAIITSAVDTSAADTTIVITGQKAVAGDTLTLERYMVEFSPGY